MEVEKHPEADKLFVEKIDIGEEKPRTICSGLVGKVEQSDLLGRMVVIMANLKSVTMRGITSEGMVCNVPCAVNALLDIFVYLRYQYPGDVR